MKLIQATSLLVLATVAFTTDVIAQAKAKDPQLVACREANVKREQELDAMLEKGRKDGKISAAELKSFTQIENRIKQRRATLTRDGFTVADCNAMTQDYASAKVELEKMLATAAAAPAPTQTSIPPASVVRQQAVKTPSQDPKVAECRAGNAALDKELDALFTKAKANNRINAAERSRYLKIENEMTAKRAQLSRDGFTLADCQSMTSSFKSAKAEVEKMIASAETRPVSAAPGGSGPPPSSVVRQQNQGSGDPKLVECRNKNATLDKEIDQIFTAAKAAGKITPVEAARYKELEAKIAARRAHLTKDGFTMADCTAMTRDYEAEKAEVSRMAQ